MEAPTGLKMKVRVGNPVGNNFVSFQDTSYDTLLVCDSLQGILLIDQSQFQFLLWNFTQFPNAAAQPPPLDLTVPTAPRRGTSSSGQKKWGNILCLKYV